MQIVEIVSRVKTGFSSYIEPGNYEVGGDSPLTEKLLTKLQEEQSWTLGEADRKVAEEENARRAADKARADELAKAEKDAKVASADLELAQKKADAAAEKVGGAQNEFDIDTASVATVKEWAAKQDSADVLTEALNGENARDKPRAGAVSALEDRLNALGAG